jgi:hypothetical protein
MCRWVGGNLGERGGAIATSGPYRFGDLRSRTADRTGSQNDAVTWSPGCVGPAPRGECSRLTDVAIVGRTTHAPVRDAVHGSDRVHGIHRIAVRGMATDVGQPMALRIGADAAGSTTAVEGVDTERHEIDADRPVRPISRTRSHRVDTTLSNTRPCGRRSWRSYSLSAGRPSTYRTRAARRCGVDMVEIARTRIETSPGNDERPVEQACAL